MPNIKSAKKRMKTDALRALRNKSRKSELRTAEKKFLSSVEVKDLESAKTLLSQVSSLYDKAAKVKTLHKNQANRKKSRLHALFVKIAGPNAKQ